MLRSMTYGLMARIDISRIVTTSSNYKRLQCEMRKTRYSQTPKEY